MATIDEYQDVLDTRDILERISDLETDLVDQAADTPGRADTEDELRELTALIDEIRDYSGDTPEHGVQLIRYSYFADYAKDLYLDCWEDADEKISRWPFRHIDWDAAAAELRIDYTEVTFRGVEYFHR